MADYVRILLAVIYVLLFKTTGITMVCTINRDYSPIQQTSEEMKICYANQSCVNYLKHDSIYSGCQMGKNNIQKTFLLFSLTRHKRDNNTMKTKVCDSNGDGKWTAKDCKPVSTYIYKKLPNRGYFDVYILSCGFIEGVDMNTDAEIPDEDDIRFQISGFDYKEISQKTAQFHPAQKVHCHAQCKESEMSAKMSTTANPNMNCTNNVCRIGSIDSSKNTGTLKCGNIARNSFVKYILKFKFEAHVYSLSSDKRKSNVFDSGEAISCNVSDPNPPKDANILTMFIDSVSIIAHNPTDKSIIYNTDKLVAEIPHNSPATIGFICYWGNNTDVADKMSFFSISTGVIKVGSLYNTYVTSATSGTIPSTGDRAYDFPISSTIKCNSSAYGVSNVLLTIFTVTEKWFPLSNFQSMPGFAASQNKVTEAIVKAVKKSNTIRFVVCSVNGNKFSTPVLLFSGDRPHVEWIYINPPWKTEYQLRNFVIGCKGEHISKMSVKCDNCIGHQNFRIRGESMILTSITVSSTAPHRLQRQFSCVGSSTKYPDEIIHHSFFIIVTQFTDLDSSIKFYELNADSLSCKSQFTIVDNGIKRKTINMMTFLYIDQQKFSTSEVHQSILIKAPYKNANTIYFEYCCPKFVEEDYIYQSKYVCAGKRELKVARNKYIKYSIPLNNVFPGNTLKCYICVNYTTDTTSMECLGERRIQSLISMIVKYPNETVIKYEKLNQVKMPVEELLPNKSGYYPIYDYKVMIGCLVKPYDNVIMDHLVLRSCNNNPPPIKIMPPEKTMFLVGDIFSCSTDAINCKNSLSYTISIQRGSAIPYKIRSHSYMFTRENVGNNILIRCIGGSQGTVEDTRQVRVESEPYNITIHNVKPIMMYTEYLFCTSKGFPSPLVNWIQKEGPTILRVSEGLVLIGPWASSGIYKFDCETKNKRGSLYISTEFEVFNPRIVLSELDTTFYKGVPLITFLFLILIFLSLFLVFQEGVFGIPLFSSYIAMAPSNTKTQQYIESPEPKASEIVHESPPPDTDTQKDGESNN